MRYLLRLLLLNFFMTSSLLAQNDSDTKTTSQYYTIEGQLSNKLNGNFLPDAVVTVYDDVMQEAVGSSKTDVNGYYKVSVPHRKRYRVEAKKSTYYKTEQVIQGKTKLEQEELNLTLMNKPGYMFDVTIFDAAHRLKPINSLRDCKIEIYNNTTKEQELTKLKHPKSVFNFPFNEGNHYTVLVRKKGYINHRIEVYVNINGCILCVHGMGVKEPDVVEMMHHGNEAGYFLGAIDMDSIYIGKKLAVPNIYYDFDKWAIRPDAAEVLDKLSLFLKDNPAITVELGSHTDSRGSDNYNQVLSGRRAESAVQYLVNHTGLDTESITWKGYGEMELVNECEDRVKCSEEAHQMNRRTELKITGYKEEDPLWEYSLKQIIEDKDLYRKIIQQEKELKKFRTTKSVSSANKSTE